MKKYKIFLIVLISIYYSLTGFGQNGMTLKQLQQFNNLYFPALNQNNTLINCSPPITAPVCNYICNNEYATIPNPNVTNPFGNGDIPCWGNSHGVPRLVDVTLGIQPPPGVSNFALLPYSNNGTQNLSSGIVQKIAPLQPGQNYWLRFYEKNASFFFLNALALVEIYLINCSDYQNFNVNSNALPAVPVNSQRIFCETNYAATVQLGPWQNRTIGFSVNPNSNFDMIWIVAKPTVTGLYPPGFYCFTLAELLKVNNFSIGSVNNNPNPCITTLITNCTINGSLLTWTGPANQVVTGNTISVDLSIPANVGLWMVTLTTPNANPNNSTCGNNTIVSASVNLLACGAPLANCINIPLIQ
jgi:hypothetical protein